MSSSLTILLVGGYGTFGGRIVELLEDEPRLSLIIAGRSMEKAAAYCRGREKAKANLAPTFFDRDGNLAVQLEALKPDVLIDASGPFQAYGADRYRLIEACIARKVHYLDLADGSAFVAGVNDFDDAARMEGVWVLTGVSSFPVLTAAVVRRLSSGMARIDTIHGGIAPSPYAGVGENVIRAIASYAGQPVSIKKDGRITTDHPFTEHMRFTIAPGGRLPLRNTLFSLVDVPDLVALANLWPQARTIWMGAGPVPELLHRALVAWAWLVRLRVLPSLSFLAPLMHIAMNHLRWGEHRGGMFVAVQGAAADGTPLERSWHLLAEGADGPLIPSMAVEAIVRRVLDGHVPTPGARAAVRELELDDYERLFERKTIYTGLRDDLAVEKGPLYARLLGPAWPALPEPIRQMHDLAGTRIAKGNASVERGTGLLSRIAAAIIGFPSAAESVPVRVEFRECGGTETWTRTFGGKTFSSEQFAGQGRSDSLLCERFGPLTFAMALVLDDECLRLVLRRWSLFGLPLPLWLAPRSDAYESVEGGRFAFHVEISHPISGLIVRYRGRLAIVEG
ncbi:SDR family oxidoreductase [Hyphomicrobium sp. CS1BSMeth3]|uniref:SDR family oxidoreductase n=1 Tax=Hyphomicrobium sp. CS1BSMeth3 TaxID=1892844 RepID=UPI0009308270|nr:SDR family oxidoreductase [Hyphomicrobium sp. CS1BSMeth3]